MDKEDAAPDKSVLFYLTTIEDIPSLLCMMEEFYRIDGYPFNRSLTTTNLERFMGDPHLGRLWLIKCADMLVGYIVLTFGFSFEYKGRDGFIDELFLTETYRHLGIGKRAIEFVLSQAHTIGLKTLHLEVEIHNHAAKQLYIKAGFASKGRELLSIDLDHRRGSWSG